MKRVWVNCIPWNKDMVTAALEAGADAVVVESGKSDEVHRLGIIPTVAPDGDIRVGEDVNWLTIENKADEERAAELGQKGMVVARTTDWTIIPLENLIAAAASLMAVVHTLEEALTVTQTLERGVDGVVLETKDPLEIQRVVDALQAADEQVELQSARIVAVETLGMGDRVCVDTCSSMGVGEGMLAGNSSSAMFLIHAESVSNPYVDPRPFRVNAGAVHAYVRVAEGKTRYLADLRSGDTVLLVKADGTTRTAHVGRVKIERRPLALIRAEAEGKECATIVQNAETIRLVTPDGAPVSVVELKAGDEVLVALEAAGRHFGMKIEETIEEH